MAVQRWRAVAAVLLLFTAFAARGEGPPLILEAKIPLGAVRGRLDHFAVDAARERLFLAELGNGTVAVIDWNKQQRVQTITGLHEPQGLGYVAATDTLYVANGGDGSVQLFQGVDLAPNGRIELGKDADNIRIDDQGNRVFVGYGQGAIAVLDPHTGKKISEIPLEAHPESFQIDSATGRIYVNLPDAGQIAVLELGSGRLLAKWPLRVAGRNYPMALDADANRVVTVTRRPSRVIAFNPDGSVASTLETCDDADDVLVDKKRHRIYVSCGEGFVDVLQGRSGSYVRAGRVPTASGARTAFFFPRADRLYVAVRASGTEPAAVWVFRPATS